MLVFTFGFNIIQFHTLRMLHSNESDLKRITKHPVILISNNNIEEYTRYFKCIQYFYIILFYYFS